MEFVPRFRQLRRGASWKTPCKAPGTSEKPLWTLVGIPADSLDVLRKGDLGPW